MAKVLKYVLQNIHDDDKARAFRRNILHERGPLLINLCKCNGNDETRYQNHLAVKTFNMPKKTIIKNEIANDLIGVIRQDLSANFSKSVCANVSKLLR